VPDVFKHAGVVVQHQLERLGLHVTEQLVATASSVTRCSDAKVDACLFGWLNGPDPGPFFALNLLSSAIGSGPTLNFARLRSPAVDRATQRAQAAVGPVRARLFAEANRLALSEAAVIPLVWPHNLILHSPDVLAVGPLDVDYSYTSVR
jgi:ABC-type oligopeptide transport system substrate-binding subunit